ncbi:MAG: HAD family hydrolase [Armatimonadota bacterium]
MIEAVIFDMDGVLIDSEPFIREAAVRMFAERGLTVQPEDFLPFTGAGEERFIGGVAELYGVNIDLEADKNRTYQLYDELVRGNLEPLCGVCEFIEKARQRGLKLAVASAADRIKVEINLREMGFSPDMFDALVTGSDVVNKKPDPEIFLAAANRMCVEPANCLVCEDAVNGAMAARAAGMKCLGITTSFTPQQLEADWHAPNLGKAPDEVLEW